MRIILALLIGVFSTVVLNDNAQAQTSPDHPSFSHFFVTGGSYNWLYYYQRERLLLVGHMDSSGNYSFNYLGIGWNYSYFFSTYNGRPSATTVRLTACVSTSLLLVGMILNEVPSYIQQDLNWSSAAKNLACGDILGNPRQTFDTIAGAL